MTQESRPKAKAGLLFQAIDKELLVHAPHEGVTYCLNDSAAQIFNECTGEHTPDAIRAKVSALTGTPMSNEVLWIGLEELRRRGLLDTASLQPTRFNGMSRRAMLRDAGLKVAAPVILAIVAEPALAQSGACNCAAAPGSNSRPPGCGCNSNGQCCNNVCGVLGTICTVSGGVVVGPGCCPVVVCGPANASGQPPGCACVGNANCASNVCAAPGNVCLF